MSLTVFRADAGLAIGAGHLMRCLAFSETLTWASWTTEFASNADGEDIVPSLASGHRQMRSIDGKDDPSAILDLKPDAIVIDHYKVDASYERAFAKSNVPVVVFDDLANRAHSCDILVDPTPGRSVADYSDLMERPGSLLLGPLYAQLWPVWRKLGNSTRERHVKGGPVKRIVVSMGATDPQNSTIRVLRALSSAKLDIDIDIVLGNAGPHHDAVSAALGPRMRLHVDPDNYPMIVAAADLAIGAAGSSTFERSVLGLPSILIKLFDNQDYIAASFAAAGAAEVVTSQELDDAQMFGGRIAKLVRDDERRLAISKAVASLTDGRGTLRLLAALARDVADASGARVRLRLAEQEDEKWILKLQECPETRRHFRNSRIPTAPEHHIWMRRAIADPNIFFAMIEVDGICAGTVRLDHNDRAPNVPNFEVSIAVDRQFVRRGIAMAALTLIRRIFPEALLDAMVLPENIASRRLFLSAGYAQISIDRYRCTPS
jgi:UDP-2,4-diacetamido-2,4,6-trideoxy-beta-L-altropyranose hydrolase